METWDPIAGVATDAPPLREARAAHTATLLPDGRVLVIGGTGVAGQPLGSTELRDPETGRFQTAQSLTTPRSAHTATLLPDGRVLVIGGIGVDGRTLATAEVWDPEQGAFTPTGTLLGPRSNHTALLLPDGRVLVVGGQTTTGTGPPLAVASAEIWDAVTGVFTLAGSLPEARSGASATLLSDGRVLLVGGEDSGSAGGGALASAGVWDPATDAFSSTGSLAEARTGHTATLLAGDHVLVVGGTAAGDSGRTLASAEVWDPVTGTFASAGAMADARQGHTATLLPDGRVLVAGGHDDRVALASTEVWDPATQTFVSSAGDR